MLSIVNLHEIHFLVNNIYHFIYIYIYFFFFAENKYFVLSPIKRKKWRFLVGEGKLGTERGSVG